MDVRANNGTMQLGVLNISQTRTLKKMQMSSRLDVQCSYRFLYINFFLRRIKKHHAMRKVSELKTEEKCPLLV